jgi:hypothetical protein
VNRTMRWVVGTGLVVIVIALVFGLGVVAWRVAALSRAGCPMSNTAGPVEERSECPMRWGATGEAEAATADGGEALDAPSRVPTPTDLEILQNPELSIPPGRVFSCH